MAPHEVPLTAIHRAYLAAFTIYVTTELPDTRRQAQKVMEGTLPFLLAQSRREGLLDRRDADDRRSPGNPAPHRHERALDRLLQDVFREDP